MHNPFRHGKTSHGGCGSCGNCKRCAFGAMLTADPCDGFPLDQLPAGATATICQVNGEGALRHRLLDMGLTPGTAVTVQKRAPMGDPIELYLRNYELSLRVNEARQITVRPAGTQAPHTPAKAKEAAK